MIYLLIILLSADYNRKTSFDSASSSEYSDNDNFSERQLSFIDEDEDPANDGAKASTVVESESESDSDDEDVLNKIVSQKCPTRITMKLHVTDKVSSSWDSVSINAIFYKMKANCYFKTL